jgi:hypothetical protein
LVSAKNLEFFGKFFEFFSNYMCREQLYAVQQIFWNIFEQIKNLKQSFFFTNMACISKMVSTNDNSLIFKNGFHKWGWVSIKGS